MATHKSDLVRNGGTSVYCQIKVRSSVLRTHWFHELTTILHILQTKSFNSGKHFLIFHYFPIKTKERLMRSPCVCTCPSVITSKLHLHILSFFVDFLSAFTYIILHTLSSIIQSILKSLQLRSWPRNSCIYRIYIPLPCAQKLTTGPHMKPIQWSTHLDNQIL
jgi:hypothetical protein